LPPDRYGKQWAKIIDTADHKNTEQTTYKAGDKINVTGRSVVVLLNKRL
jgi:hypothetical protein